MPFDKICGRVNHAQNDSWMLSVQVWVFLLLLPLFFLFRLFSYISWSARCITSVTALSSDGLKTAKPLERSICFHGSAAAAMNCHTKKTRRALRIRMGALRLKHWHRESYSVPGCRNSPGDGTSGNHGGSSRIHIRYTHKEEYFRFRKPYTGLCTPSHREQSPNEYHDLSRIPCMLWTCL